MSSVIDNFTAYLPSAGRRSVKYSWTFNTSGSHKLLSNLIPSISAWTTHGMPLITSPSKMTTVLIHRNAPTDSCRNLTALMPRCTKTSFLITPQYICAHRNSDNLHNAAFKGYSLVRRIFALSQSAFQWHDIHIQESKSVNSFSIFFFLPLTFFLLGSLSAISNSFYRSSFPFFSHSL